MHLAVSTPSSTTRAAIEALLATYHCLDALADSECRIDRATHAKAVELLHRIEDTISTQSAHCERIDLSVCGTTMDFKHAWTHHAALKLLAPLVNRLSNLGFKITTQAVQ